MSGAASPAERHLLDLHRILVPDRYAAAPVADWSADTLGLLAARPEAALDELDVPGFVAGEQEPSE